jgi:hypothetical protein
VIPNHALILIESLAMLVGRKDAPQLPVPRMPRTPPIARRPLGRGWLRDRLCPDQRWLKQNETPPLSENEPCQLIGCQP